MGYPFEPLTIHFLYNASQDSRFRHIAGVHLPQHSLQLVRRENVTQDVKDLARAPGV
jgi:hypothetical protein